MPKQPDGTPGKKPPAPSLRSRKRMRGSMMPLSIEKRRALAMLAASGRDGATQALLSAHGFDASLIAELVNHGLASLMAEKVSADGKLIAVVKARITDAGRDAVADES